jgi:hypothetical protein
VLKKSKILVLVFFAACLILYLENMAPSFNSDDSPETTVAYQTLGIQHPPGYPLATMTGKIFTLLPLGSPAFRANLAAVVLNLLAAFAVYMLAGIIFRKVFTKLNAGVIEAAALSAAAMYVFSASSWLQGSIAKGSIYALNSLLLSLCFISLFKMEKSVKYFYLFGLVFGLSMCNHWTSMAAAAPAFIYYIVIRRKAPGAKNYAVAFLFFALGALAYAYVPVRNAGSPVYAWGDVKSVNGLFWLVSRAQYAGMEIKHSFSDTVGLLKFYIRNLFTSEYPWYIALASLFGAAAAVFLLPAEGAALLISYIMLAAAVASFATPPPDTEWIIKPYLVSSGIFTALFAALVIFYPVNAIKKGKIRDTAAYAAFVLITCACLFCGNPGYSRYFIGYDYSRNLAKTLTPGCIFFTEGDMNVGSALYLTLVDRENFAPVIPVVSLYPWYIAQLKRNYGAIVNFPAPAATVKGYIADVIAANSGKDFFYSNVFTGELLEPGTLAPAGITYRIKGAYDRAVITDRYMKLYSFRGLTGDKTGYDEFTRRLVVENYAMAYFNLADALRTAGNNAAAADFYEKGLYFYRNHGAYINAGFSYYTANMPEKALEMWQKALETGPKDSVVYLNIAYIYISRKDYSTAVEYVKKAITLNPDNQAALKLIRVLEKTNRPE